MEKNTKHFLGATEIVMGNGSRHTVGSEIERIGRHRVYVTTDSFLSGTAHFQDILAAMTAANIEYQVYDRIQPDPSCELCDRLTEQAKAFGADAVLGYGGGSCMDTAKAIAALATNGGRCAEWDYRPLDIPALPIICVPTTAGTGSEVTFVAVITDEEKQYKMSLMDDRYLVPRLAFCDPEITYGLPASLTASCGMDALTHAIEAYTSPLAQCFSDALALHAIRLISESLPTAVREPSDKAARESMLIASTIAGMAFINSNVGGVHAIAETVGAMYHIPHGVSNAIFLPYITRFNLKYAPARYADVARACGLGTQEEEDVLCERLTNYLEELIGQLDIPSLSSYSAITPDSFDKIAQRAAENPLSLDNAGPIAAEDYKEVLRIAYKK